MWAYKVGGVIHQTAASSSSTSALIDAHEAIRVSLKIAIIIFVALVLRYLLHRAIRKLTRRTIDGKMAVMLKPLRGRARRVVQAATGVASERRKQRAQTINSVLQSAASITIFTVALLMIFGSLGIQLAPVIASAGIVGVALGFGAQNMVKDFLNGIFMILEDQYGIGDVVDLGAATGTIEAVGLRTTRLRDVEGVVWYVRNGEVVRVGNKSQGTANVVVDMPVAHGTDLQHAQQLMREVLAQLTVETDPQETYLDDPQVLGVESVTPIAITLRATLTTAPAARWQVAREVRQRFSSAFGEAGINSPTAVISAASVNPTQPDPTKSDQ